MNRSTVLMSALAAVAAPAVADAAGAPALARPETATTGVLEVTSRAFEPNASIPTMYSRQGKSISPPIAWAGAPKPTKSFVVIAEDSDAPGNAPFTHWVVFDIPGTVTGLPRAVKVAPEPKNGSGARQGRNAFGTVGYSGPIPPAADPPHHYHFEVFALDRLLKLRPGVDREAVVRALSGHVLAKGELVGSFRYLAPKPSLPSSEAAPG